MKLFLFRISLKRKMQKDAFERLTPKGEEFSREAWLRDIFSKQFPFVHRGNELVFVPQDQESLGFGDEFIIGWVARERLVSERTSPADGLDPTEHLSWQASLFLLDPRHHSDGQKAALESKGDVGGVQAILASLGSHLTDLGPEEPYTASVYPIIEARSFKKFSDAHSGRIKTITYDVAVPNMFGSPNDFSSEMASLRDNANIAHIRTTLESDGAINTETSQLDEIASHVERGGGTITAKTTDGEQYRSNEHAVSATIEADSLDPREPVFWGRIKEALTRIFL